MPNGGNDNRKFSVILEENLLISLIVIHVLFQSFHFFNKLYFYALLFGDVVLNGNKNL